MAKHQIVSRYDSSKVLFECELPEGIESGMAVRHALEQAVKRGAYLRGANLSDADLRGAYLRDADLSGADLRGAYLRDADLRGADLRDAYLRDADLSDAYLRDADLSGADLSGANLSGANLSGADLSEQQLIMYRDDIWAVLSSAPHEAAAVLGALRAGRVDGSTYSGECACLVGTIAKHRQCDVDELGALKPDASRPAEQWFMQIQPGQLPAEHKPAMLATQWVAEWIDAMQAAFGPKVEA